MLNPPDDPLPSLPTVELGAGTRLARIHRSGVAAWSLSSHPHGRFNLEAPRGTVYLADDPLCCLLEVLGRGATIDRMSAARFRLSWLELRSTWRLADLTDRKAKAAGINAEIHSTADYELTRAWATAISADHDGVVYRPRSDPSTTLKSIALFSTKQGKSARTVSTTALSEDLLTQAAHDFGITILRRLLP